MAESVFLRRLSRWQAEQQRETFADLWVEAYRGVAGHMFQDRQEFLRRFAEDLSLPGFDMVIASAANGVVGCAYGFRADRDDGSWRNLDEGRLPEVEELTASGQVFAVAELMVLPANRREGVATRMLDQLLTRADSTLAIARVLGANERAGEAFRAWGWTEIDRRASGRYAGHVPRGGPEQAAPAPRFWSRHLPH
jgi:GNAT superfamily N-acetyltransferase